MKESEAKTKWCPMYRAMQTSETFMDNRPLPFDKEMQGICLGSECMAWRRNEPTCKEKKKGTTHGIAMLYSEWGDKYERMPDTGHCGLAGKP